MPLLRKQDTVAIANVVVLLMLLATPTSAFAPTVFTTNSKQLSFNVANNINNKSIGGTSTDLWCHGNNHRRRRRSSTTAWKTRSHSRPNIIVEYRDRRFSSYDLEDVFDKVLGTFYILSYVF